MVFPRTAQEEDEQETPGERRRPDEDARAGHRREKQRHLAAHLEEDEAHQPVRRPKDNSREAQARPSLIGSRARKGRRVGHDRGGAHIQLGVEARARQVTSALAASRWLTQITRTVAPRGARAGAMVWTCDPTPPGAGG